MTSLLTERLRLRPLEADDCAAFVAQGNNWEIAQRMEKMPHPLKLEDAQKFITQTAGRNYGFFQQHDGEAVNGQLVGTLSYSVCESAPETATLGYWIGQDFWGQGYASEALMVVISDLFLNQGFQILDAKVAEDNSGSLRLLQKLGFAEVGVAACTPVNTGKPIEAKRFALNRAQFDALYVKAGCALPYPNKVLPMVLVSAVALIDSDGRILLAQRPEGKSMAGLWEFPGGKVEQGETPEAALKRELKEELGIDTELSCFAPLTFASHSYDTFHLLMPVYACRTYMGTPQGKEGQNLKWVPISKLRDYPMPEADIPLIALIQDFL